MKAGVWSAVVVVVVVLVRCWWRRRAAAPAAVRLGGERLAASGERGGAGGRPGLAAPRAGRALLGSLLCLVPCLPSPLHALYRPVVDLSPPPCLLARPVLLAPRWPRPLACPALPCPALPCPASPIRFCPSAISAHPFVRVDRERLSLLCSCPTGLPLTRHSLVTRSTLFSVPFLPVIRPFAHFCSRPSTPFPALHCHHHSHHRSLHRRTDDPLLSHTRKPCRSGLRSQPFHDPPPAYRTIPGSCLSNEPTLGHTSSSASTS
ncbi:uncharacterized protein PSFLO_00964 [Pseudozyma flocculosa]|uniref:Uncharacterized protein n=1 Tax=Pseudozyma flocculosa TaxID=84751 RepID=A0A5C3ET14_9BASI|nr:uncharacterized protein PSFLO_00964 [Pseudozyma flocculosa]